MVAHVFKSSSCSVCGGGGGGGIQANILVQSQPELHRENFFFLSFKGGFAAVVCWFLLFFKALTSEGPPGLLGLESDTVSF